MLEFFELSHVEVSGEPAYTPASPPTTNRRRKRSSMRRTRSAYSTSPNDSRRARAVLSSGIGAAPPSTTGTMRASYTALSTKVMSLSRRFRKARASGEGTSVGEGATANASNAIGEAGFAGAGGEASATSQRPSDPRSRISRKASREMPFVIVFSASAASSSSSVGRRIPAKIASSFRYAWIIS